MCVCVCVRVSKCVFAIADCDDFFREGTNECMSIHYLRADLALVLGMIPGDVPKGPGRLLLHARTLGVAAHRRDQGLDPPLCVFVCVCVCE